MLADYYFSDSRLTLIPIEHLSPTGMSVELASLIVARRGWTAAQVALFNAAFALYWERAARLAVQAREWRPPRLRHVAVVHESLTVRPYAQLFNTSAWTLYASDLDPGSSHAELAAYLLVHGDRMAGTGEVTEAAVLDAAYWFERSDEECDAFARAAAKSTRPDAEAFRALAASLPWLRQLHHDVLRPPPATAPMRAIPNTGVLVPRTIEHEPQRLIERWTQIATATVSAYHRRWQRGDMKTVSALCDWLRSDVPPLLVAADDRIVWDPVYPERMGSLRALVRNASGAAVGDVLADLVVVAARTRAFHAALATPEALPTPDPKMAQGGYTFIHPDRALIAYNLHEPGMERLHGPALPFARDMLAARTIHEWAHLAVDAGWVPCAASGAELERCVATLAEQLEYLPSHLLPAVARSPAPRGLAWAQRLLARLPDFQANVLAQRFLTPAERETYVRHNIRTLRGVDCETDLGRMLIRYLVEYQYLRFSAVTDRRTFFLRSTWFDADFIASGLLDDAQVDALLAAVAHILDAYAVDERFVATVSQR